MPKNKQKMGHADIADSVMKQIHTRHIGMRPRIYFIIGSLLLGIGMACFSLLTIVCIASIVFHLRVHGPFAFLWFGAFGIRPFLATFPWGFFLLSSVTVWGGIRMLQNYDISYKRNFLVVTTGFVTFLILTGIMLDRTGVSEQMVHLPALRQFYIPQRRQRDWITGEILRVGNQTLLVSTPPQEEILVIWDDNTYLPWGSHFAVGEYIRAVGVWNENLFVARGIARVGNAWRLYIFE